MGSVTIAKLIALVVAFTFAFREMGKSRRLQRPLSRARKTHW